MVKPKPRAKQLSANVIDMSAKEDNKKTFLLADLG